MKKTILLLAILFLFVVPSNAQIALAHAYNVPNHGFAPTQGEIVNLSLSGKKIMIRSATYHDTLTPAYIDTIYFYNMDYSFWKKIACPNRNGYGIQNVSYASETLFNTDALLEIAVLYSGNPGKYLIVNENGVAVDSMLPATGGLKVYAVDTLGIGWQAMVYSMPNTTYTTTYSIFNLPGSLPCPTCSGNTAGIANVEKSKKSIQTRPLPNPSNNEVKITFTLPEGINEANLVLYSTTGQKIKSFAVDNRFGYILLDNSQLASGVYYYNIESNGVVSSTQKMVVVK